MFTALFLLHFSCKEASLLYSISLFAPKTFAKYCICHIFDSLAPRGLYNKGKRLLSQTLD